MAKTVIVQAICDRCTAEGKEGSEGAEEVSFVYDGYAYALDLCAPHAEEFHKTVNTMMGWATDRSPVAGSRRARGGTTPDARGPVSKPSRQPPRRDKQQTTAIRDWANANGYKVSNRGRIPADVEAACNAAH